MFEPVHGSAPDIAGRGSPTRSRRCCRWAMMLDHLGAPQGSRGRPTRRRPGPGPTGPPGPPTWAGRRPRPVGRAIREALEEDDPDETPETPARACQAMPKPRLSRVEPYRRRRPSSPTTDRPTDRAPHLDPPSALFGRAAHEPRRLPCPGLQRPGPQSNATWPSTSSRSVGPSACCSRSWPRSSPLDDGRYLSHDFQSWREVSEAGPLQGPRTTTGSGPIHFEIQVPRVIRL